MPAGASPKKRNARWSGRASGTLSRCRSTPRCSSFASKRFAKSPAKSHRMPSGPLHDAAEVSRAGIPAVMMFVQSLGGISHNKIENTREEHLEMSVVALDRLASKTVDWILRT